MLKVLDVLFGCSHKHYTFPMSARGPQRCHAAAMTGTYVVCLDCGKEFPYDWRQMKVMVPPAGDGGSLGGAKIADRAA